MSLFSRACRSCGEKPRPTVAEMISGEAGQVRVELSSFPYESCTCGKKTRWAFDPGAEFSTQIFWEGLPYAKGSNCARCDARLGEPTSVELHSEARVADFAPIGFRTTLPGYRCAACGLEQAPPGAFDTGMRGSMSDGASALNEAVATVGLR